VTLSVPGLTRPPEGGQDDEAAPRRGSRGGRGLAGLGFGKGGRGNGHDGGSGRLGVGRTRNAGTDPQRTVPVRPNAQVAARVGLWALVALGALGGLVGLLRPTTQAAAPSSAGSDADVMPPEVAGFGELAVTTWIEAEGDGAEARLDPLFAVDPPANAGDAGRRRVNGDATAIAAREVSDGYWAVTVVAPVDEMDDAGHWQAAGNWYVEVGVASTAEGLVAVAEPAIVPAPTQPADAPEPAGDGLGVPAQEDEDMATTVEGFLRALMAGDGDVSRYLAPDVEILPVTPAPFRDVTLQRWAVTDTGEHRVRVRLAARATSEGGVPRTVSYELGLAEREGRWEVTSMSGAPTIDREDTTAARSPSTTLSSSPTTAPESETTVSFASEPGA
jgi:hypothetical protein